MVDELRDDYYPTVNSNFIIEKIINSGKIIEESKVTKNNTTSFLLKGHKPIYKRFIYVRTKDGEVNYNQAIAHAVRFKFLNGLVDWLKDNKNWDEG